MAEHGQYYYNFEDSKAISRDIINLSTKYQVLCEKTAYILVVQENEYDNTDSIKIDIPNADSIDYSPSSSQ